MFFLCLRSINAIYGKDAVYNLNYAQERSWLVEWPTRKYLFIRHSGLRFDFLYYMVRVSDIRRN